MLRNSPQHQIFDDTPLDRIWADIKIFELQISYEYASKITYLSSSFLFKYSPDKFPESKYMSVFKFLGRLG
jgi:hypothetical protein